MITALCFGAGVDSSALLLGHLRGDFDLGIDLVVHADTGGEKSVTGPVVERFRRECMAAGIPFAVVKKKGETIIEWCTRLGTVPVMPGGSHACSQKFKAEPIHRYTKAWRDENRPGDQIEYLIGIEHNEGARCKRFTKPRGDASTYRYPLIDMEMTRADCVALLDRYGVPVEKSSCVFCPFMQPEEIADIAQDPAAWHVVQLVERRFAETSAAKYQAWLDAGQPKVYLKSVDKNGNRRWRAPAGMWRRDSWAEGARLFAKRVDGKQLSVDEWAERVNAPRAARGNS